MDEDAKIYQCGCGGTEFLLGKDGQVECTECEHVITGIEVRFPEGIPDAA